MIPVLLTLALAKPADVQDLVYLSPKGPVRISFRVRVGNEVTSKAWNDYVDRYFAFHDRNNDGVLDATEVARLIRLPMYPNQLLFNGRRANAPVSMAEVDADKNGKVTREELRAFFRKTGFSAVSASVQPQNQAAQQLTDALYKHLDKNKDGRLSRNELADAPQVLAALDVDEDEIITPQELLQQPQSANQYAVQVQRAGLVQPQMLGGSLTFVVIVPGESTANLARRLAQGAATPKKTEAEWAEWIKKPAELVLDIDLSGAIRASGPLAPAVKPAGDALARLALPGARIEIARGSAGTRFQDGSIAFYMQQFQMAAGDKKALTKQQLTENPNLQFFTNLFDDADRNGDGKLTVAEAQAYLDLFADSIGCQVQISVADSGRGLFDLLDTDRSGGLSVRELRNGVALLTEYAAASGALAKDDLPRQFRVTAGRNGVTTVTRRVAVAPTAMATYSYGPGKGPDWFRKMDRNKDGDLSPREFLGTPEEFRRLDLDGDGLISAEEAEKAGKK